MEKTNENLIQVGQSLLPSLIGDSKDFSKDARSIDRESFSKLIEQIKIENQSKSQHDQEAKLIRASQLSLSYIRFSDQILQQMSADVEKDGQSGKVLLDKSQFEHLHRQVVSLQLDNDSYRKHIRECWDLVKSSD